MCDVVSALSAASTVIGAFGQIQAANAQAAAAEYQAQINEQNAVLADRRAKDAIERGQLEEERKKREGTLFEKEQQASFAAANIDTGYGTPLDLISATASAMDLDAAVIRSNAEREAYDNEVEGVNFRNQAQLNRFEASNARRAGVIGAVGTVLSGGAGIFRYRASQLAV